MKRFLTLLFIHKFIDMPWHVALLSMSSVQARIETIIIFYCICLLWYRFYFKI